MSKPSPQGFFRGAWRCLHSPPIPIPLPFPFPADGGWDQRTVPTGFFWGCSAAPPQPPLPLPSGGRTGFAAHPHFFSVTLPCSPGISTLLPVSPSAFLPDFLFSASPCGRIRPFHSPPTPNPAGKRPAEPRHSGFTPNQLHTPALAAGLRCLRVQTPVPGAATPSEPPREREFQGGHPGIQVPLLQLLPAGTMCGSRCRRCPGEGVALSLPHLSCSAGMRINPQDSSSVNPSLAAEPNPHPGDPEWGFVREGGNSGSREGKIGVFWVFLA